MSTMMSYRYLPYVTVPTRITKFSTTCIDHIFMKKSNKEKVLSTLCCCDISDHLPCYISLQYANNSYTGYRPMTRMFGARNCSKFAQKMTTENWTDKYKILYCHQYGFRKFYSTLLALIEVTDLIKRFLDEKQYVIGIFIDFRKVFDTVNHDILLDKLECYGIRWHANKFFRSYLTNRRQYTLVNGIKSNFGYVNCGVPQGSVLGPLLFLLYINDIKHAFGCDNVKLFADDTFLFTNDRNIYAAKEKASTLFEKNSRWCVANQLSINSEKTNFVLFHKKNKPIPEHFDCIQQRFLPLI